MTITEAERCDSCSARAVWVARLGAWRLYFCGHHHSINHRALRADGWGIVEVIQP